MNYLHSKLFLQLGFKLDSGRDSASKLLCGDPGSITVHRAGNEKKGKWAGPGGSLVRRLSGGGWRYRGRLWVPAADGVLPLSPMSLWSLSSCRDTGDLLVFLEA